MFVRLNFTRTLVITGLLVAALAAVSQAQDSSKRGRKYKAPPPTSRLEVTVTRATNGKPVENASVIFHPLVDGHDSGNMELKTNDEGKAVIDVLETGSNVRLQIIAPGFQTYGEDYKIDKETMAIAVKLRRPPGQYSIYKKNEGMAGDKDKSPEKSDETKPDATKPDAMKPDQAKPQDAKPDGATDASPDASKPQDTSSPK